jgi:enamine deaminase RidA (YjgF/YER057c/UK114 family)
MRQKRYSLESEFEKLLNYSRVLVDDEWVFVSGCSGFDYSDMTISDSMTEQAEQTFRNIEWCLKKAEVTFDDVVRIRIIIADKEKYLEAAEVIGRYCKKAKPANTTWFAELPDPRIKIEIEVTAKKHLWKIKS